MPCILEYKAKTPICLQGLSHYLEHMLFMGSKKFPDENEYDAFLARHGGSSNAYTEMVMGFCLFCCRSSDES